MFPGADPAQLLIDLLAEYHAEKRLRIELAETVADLSRRVSQLESGPSGGEHGSESSRISDLEDRQMRSEAYSGRTTAIIAGIPDPGPSETPADLQEQVIDALSAAHPEIRPADFSIIHRNAPRRGKNRGKPRTVTVVFLRASVKDNIMRKVNRDRIKARLKDEVSGTTGGIYHRMSRGLVSRKEELEAHPAVEWVYFAGHSMFTVKLGAEIRHNIVNVQQLM